MSNDRYDLPPIALELEELVGRSGLDALVRISPGVPLYVPHHGTVPTTHRLCSLLGEDRFRALCQAFGGMRLMIPRMAAMRRRARDLAITEARQAGQTTRQTCFDFGITWRTAQRAYARGKAIQSAQRPCLPRQPTLWER